MRVLKGHGTENDFVVVPDLDGALALTPRLVRALCDRHAGLGADGVLRVVRCANDPDAKEFADEAEFFMDYRNADGSVAEMCGNGVRVFVRYLQRVHLVGQDAAVATRGGIKRVRASLDGNITVEMGLPRILADRPVATVAQLPAAFRGAGAPGVCRAAPTGTSACAGTGRSAIERARYSALRTARRIVTPVAGALASDRKDAPSPAEL